MPRLKFALSLCLFALALTGSAAEAADTPPPAADPCTQDPCKTAKARFPDVLERETFLNLMAEDGTHALAQAVASLSAQAAKLETATPGSGAAFLLKSANDQGYAKQVNDALWKTRSLLDIGINQHKPPLVAATDYPDPIVAALLSDPNLGLQKGTGPRELFAKLNVQKYGGVPTPPAATIPPCPDGTVRSQKSLDMLKAVAANGGDLTAALGDHGKCDPVTPSKADPKTDPTNVQTPPATVPTDHPPVKDSQAGAPPAPGKDSNDSGGGFMSGVKNFFSGLPVNQVLAGVGFGAAVGMLFGFGTPVGMIGGALIGGLLGAVMGSGIIGKLFGGGGTGGS